MKKFLLYGSYGYTGQLIAERAVQLQLQPILAGRNATKLQAQAKQLGLDWRQCALDDQPRLEALLEEVPVVLHCAGPYSQTCKPMAEACLATGTHYLDVTGEWQIFEWLAKQDARAQAQGIMLMPGVGFDVVPTDCMAAHLFERLPEAHTLNLAFQSLGQLSHGTAKTAVENLGKGGLVRREGELVKVPSAHDQREIVYADKALLSVAIPWGDVSTAWYHTGIPNITVYMSQPRRMIRLMKMTRYLGWLLNWGPVQRYLKRQVEKQAPGPSAQVRAQGYSIVWGEVIGPDHQRCEARLRTPDGYTLTALAAVHIVQKVLSGMAPIGFQTPAKAYGADLILELVEGTWQDS